MSKFILLLGMALLFSNHGKSTIVQEPLVVKMSKMSFIPKNLTIKRGQVLTFINESDSLHNVVFPLLKKRSTFISKGKEISFTFDKLGKFNYHCTPHRTMGMVGTLKVIDERDKVGKSKDRNPD